MSQLAPKTVAITGDYNALRDDQLILVRTSVAAITVRLPAGAAPGKSWTVIDTDGNASANNITVEAFEPNDLVNGAASVTIDTNYGAKEFVQGIVPGFVDAALGGASGGMTAGEIEAIVNHDNLLGFVPAEHVDWAQEDQGDIHATNIAIADIETEAGTSYTLVLADHGKTKRFTAGTTVTLTVPANATAAFAIGTCIEIIQSGAGQVQLAAAGGVTLDSANGTNLRAQHAIATLTKIATDEWVLAGDTA